MKDPEAKRIRKDAAASYQTLAESSSAQPPATPNLNQIDFLSQLAHTPAWMLIHRLAMIDSSARKAQRASAGHRCTMGERSHLFAAEGHDRVQARRAVRGIQPEADPDHNGEPAWVPSRKWWKFGVV